MRRLAWVLVLMMALAGCSDSPGRTSPGPDSRSYARRLADAPFPAHSGSVFVAVGGKLLLFGGTRHVDCSGMMSCPTGDEISAMVVYDPERGTWSRLPDLPSGLIPQPQVTTLGDKLIATNGGHFQVFDLSTKRWREYPAPPIDPANASHLMAHGHSVYALTDPSDMQSPVQRLDLATGAWSVLTRKGMGAATTRSIFWTQAGLVSAGYDSSSGAPVQAVARYGHGTWHRYDAPPRPARPAPYVSWSGLIAFAAPPDGTAQGLDPVSGDWVRVPSVALRSTVKPDGRPEVPTGSRDVLRPDYGARQYELSGHSQLWERPLNAA
jgi:hypothetical protein